MNAERACSVVRVTVLDDSPCRIWVSIRASADEAMPSSARLFARPFSVWVSRVRPFDLSASLAASTAS